MDFDELISCPASGAPCIPVETHQKKVQLAVQ